MAFDDEKQDEELSADALGEVLDEEEDDEDEGFEKEGGSDDEKGYL